MMKARSATIFKTDLVCNQQSNDERTDMQLECRERFLDGCCTVVSFLPWPMECTILCPFALINVPLIVRTMQPQGQSEAHGTDGWMQAARKLANALYVDDDVGCETS